MLYSVSGAVTNEMDGVGNQRGGFGLVPLGVLTCFLSHYSFLLPINRNI